VNYLASHLANSTMWFSSGFLGEPPPGWTVDWDAIDHTTPKPRPEKPGATIFDVDDGWDGTSYMAGILIRHVESGRVWRLTGGSTGSPPHETFEGKWPD